MKWLEGERTLLECLDQLEVANARLEGVSTAVVVPLHPHYADLLPLHSSNLYNPACVQCNKIPNLETCKWVQNYQLLVPVVITKTPTDRQSIQSLKLVISVALESY